MYNRSKTRFHVRASSVSSSYKTYFLEERGRASGGSATSKLDFVGARKAPKTNSNSKYEVVTAPKAESSRRDMQKRLILVPNGLNLHALQRSASSSKPVQFIFHDQFWFTGAASQKFPFTRYQ